MSHYEPFLIFLALTFCGYASYTNLKTNFGVYAPIRCKTVSLTLKGILTHCFCFIVMPLITYTPMER